MTDKEFIERYDKGEKFTKRELSHLIWEFDNVDEKSWDSHRWVTPVDTIISVDGRLFCVPWMRGNTECQENEFNEQPYEVIETVETVVVKRYVKKSDIS